MLNLSKFLKNESGTTAIEYGLIASLIAVAIIGAASSLGNKVGATFNAVGNKLN